MPKLNVIGMIVLCLGVAAGAAVMALRAPAPRMVDHGPRIDALIRRLADRDPDLRREAEQELKALGKAAEPALKEAMAGSDVATADRARAILGIKKPEAPKETPVVEVAVSPPAAVEGIRLTLQIGAAPRRPEDSVVYYLKLHNPTTRSLAIARHTRDGRVDYRGFGSFERIDAEGRVVTMVDAADSPAQFDVEVVLVRPGETIDLFPTAGLLRIGAKGTYKIRYVYDASEGSDYRDRVATGHYAGSALTAHRVESNLVTVTIR